MTFYITLVLTGMIVLVVVLYTHIHLVERKKNMTYLNKVMEDILAVSDEGVCLFDKNFQIIYSNKMMKNFQNKLKMAIDGDILPMITMLSMKDVEPGIEHMKLMDRLVEIPGLYPCFEVDGKPLILEVSIYNRGNERILKIVDVTERQERLQVAHMLHELFGKRHLYTTMEEIYDLIGKVLTKQLKVAGVMFNVIDESMSADMFLYDKNGHKRLERGFHPITKLYGPIEKNKLDHNHDFKISDEEQDLFYGDLAYSRAIRMEITGKYVFLVVFLYEHQHMLVKESQWLKTIAIRIKSSYDHITMMSTLSLSNNTDQLTNVANRSEFVKEIDRAIVRTSLHEHQSLVLVLLDLKGLRAINEMDGHYVGDQLLTLLSNRFISENRYEYSVGRVGGDEFGFFAEVESEEEGQKIITSIMQQTTSNIIVRGKTYRLGCNIGLAYYREHGYSSDALMEAAKEALVTSRSMGVNNYVIANR